MELHIVVVEVKCVQTRWGYGACPDYSIGMRHCNKVGNGHSIFISILAFWMTEPPGWRELLSELSGLAEVACRIPLFYFSQTYQPYVTLNNSDFLRLLDTVKGMVASTSGRYCEAIESKRRGTRPVAFENSAWTRVPQKGAIMVMWGWASYDIDDDDHDYGAQTDVHADGFGSPP